MYILSSGVQRYCTDCAREHLKEVDNKQSREWNKDHPKQMAEHKRNEKKRNKEMKKEVKQIKAKASVIKELRESKGLSKHRLSILCGMNEKTIAHIEKLENLSNVKLGTLEKIASALDMTPIEFFEKLYAKGK
jgi:ribosome-binding protein aMBF1 (putative translation factor)|nr:MAG TPA: helix-turn-helix domain protein [Caudoviricetes sp.]